MIDEKRAVMARNTTDSELNEQLRILKDQVKNLEERLQDGNNGQPNQETIIRELEEKLTKNEKSASENQRGLLHINKKLKDEVESLKQQIEKLNLSQGEISVIPKGSN
jgi:uncharacterized coiled-coil protein SlyX